MPFTLAQLAAELANDPKGLGYAALIADESGSPTPIAALLNIPGLVAGAEVFRARVDAAELTAAIDRPAFAALSATERAWLALVASAGEVDTNSPVLRANMASLFPADATSGATRARLTALSVRAASRAEQLWGAGETVTDEQIQRSLGRG